MTCPIAWSDFSWEAFATLVTGFSAVLGAFLLGKRQAEILARQTALQESTLKVAIFDRRMEVFRAVEDLVAGVLRAGGSLQRGGTESEEIVRRFNVARQEARFLFSEDVVSLLKEIRGNYLDIEFAPENMRESYESVSRPDQEDMDKKRKALEWFLNCSENLSSSFKEIRPVS